MALGDYIQGRFVMPDPYHWEWEDVSPAHWEEKLGVFRSSRRHVDLAVESARAAWLKWHRLSLSERLEYLKRLRNIFENQKELLARALSQDVGKPLWESQQEVNSLINKIDVTIEESLKLVAPVTIENIQAGVDGYLSWQSRGVLAVIAPFNFPIHLANTHIIPALATGNTIVLKPSEQAPYVSELYAQCFHEAQFPAGVFNMVQGDGSVGQALVTHEGVDGVLFTGSYEVGLKIKQDTLTHYWKIIALEMGGKNAAVVFEDADLKKAAAEVVYGAFVTAGQRCSCTSRVLVHESIFPKFLSYLKRLTSQVRVGHWSDNVFMGPLIHEKAVDKYLRFQEIAKREGVEVVIPAQTIDVPSYRGYYMSPSLYLVPRWDNQSIYQKTEIFAPNLAVYVFKDFDQTVEIVNGTGFGLVASVFTQKSSIFERALLDYRVGLLNWNRTTVGASARLPFGGIGKSGNDRPSGHFAVYYTTYPVASLVDKRGWDPKAYSQIPGMNWDLPDHTEFS